jgi:hypothetical protein
VLSRTLGALAVVLAGLVPLAGSVTPADAATLTCTVAPLLGASETPPNTSPAIGSSTVTLDTTANTVAFTLTVNGLTSGATAAHIHQAPPGVAGPIRVPLPIPTGVTAFTTAATAVTPTAGFNVADIAANPTDFYVNVHSTTFPGGEIRGQLTGCGTPTALPTAKEQCKQGGYAQYTDPSTGRRFKNQGQCVSFVAHQEHH